MSTHSYIGPRFGAVLMAAGSLTLGVIGCDVFDESLLNQDAGMNPEDGGLDATVDSAMDGSQMDTDSGPSEAGPTPEDGGDVVVDAGPSLERPADTCTSRDDVPELRPPLVEIDVSTAGFNNSFDAPQGLQCTGRATPGNDAFFKINVEAEEKWHFHITPRDEGSSPALYLLSSSCRASQCEQRNGQDLCGPKLGSRIGDEHFTFVAQAAGTWFLGVDDAVANPDGWNYRLFATRTSCGNGAETGGPEHGEACDPMGGIGSDPTCDSQCRNVLDPALSTVLTESPVNDDWTVADVLAIDPSGADALEVLGSIGQVCAYDMYAVNVAEGVSLGASLTLANGDPCPSTVPVPCDVPDGPCECDADAGITECELDTELELDLLASDGATVLGSGTVTTSSGNACPAIAGSEAFADGLSEGVYYIRLWAPEGTPRLDYKLGVELFAP